MRPQILLTGFTPFGPHAENPSGEIVHRIAALPPAGIGLETLVLPVEYDRAFDELRATLDGGRLDAALLLGLAANRPSLALERFALNWRGAPLADNAGRRIDGEPIDPAGPAAYLSTLPVDVLVAALRGAGLPCDASSHAGTFLCNQVLYQTLRHADVAGLAVRSVFLHLPDPAAPGRDGIPLDALERGVRAALARIAALPGPRRVRTRPRAPRTARARRR